MDSRHIGHQPSLKRSHWVISSGNGDVNVARFTHKTQVTGEPCQFVQWMSLHTPDRDIGMQDFWENVQLDGTLDHSEDSALPFLHT
jgi:hypothetical protein